MRVKKTSEVFIKKISENKGIIHKVCNIYCDCDSDKEDLMQEIILQLWKSFPTFQEKSKFSTWMYRIALNTAITDFRKSKKHPVVETFDGNEMNLTYEKSDNTSDDITNLYKAISKLNDIEKAIILLYLEEKTYSEIGIITGISVKNVSVKIVRIKNKLRNLLSANQ